MMHRKASIFLAFLILFCSCSHKVIRTGYEVNSQISGDCKVEVWKFATSNLKGVVQLKPRDLASKCNEADAYLKLCDEACAVGANIINIVQENKPNSKKSCYSCTADLYAAPDSVLSPNQITTTKIDRKQLEGASTSNGKIVMQIFGFVMGVAGAYFLISLIR